MFTSVDKALLVTIMGIRFIVQTYAGFSMPPPDTLATIIGLVTPVLVWATSNKKGGLSMYWQEGVAVVVLLFGLEAGVFFAVASAVRCT